VFELVKEIRRKFQTAFLLISHDLAIVSTVCDRIAIMYAGLIVEVSRTRDIFERPRHPYTKALIASLPRIRFSDKTMEPIGGSSVRLTWDPSRSERVRYSDSSAKLALERPRWAGSFSVSKSLIPARCF